MKTAGQLLSEARQKKRLSLEQVAERTKVRLEFLAAIEKDNYLVLPAGAYVKGFLQRYAQTVQLDPQTILAVFRRDYKEGKKGKIIPRDFIRPLSHRSSFFTMRNLRIGVISFILLIITGYAGSLWWRMQQPPPLNIYEPEEGETVASPIVISGKTSVDAVVFINSQPASLSRDGLFSAQVTFDQPGEQKIQIKAVDRKQRETAIVRKVKVTE